MLAVMPESALPVRKFEELAAVLDERTRVS